jgi:hypothetical protein
MDHGASVSPLRSFERHLRALNRSDNTIASYLDGARQAEAFLAARGRTFTDARRADLEAFLADLLTRRSDCGGCWPPAPARPSTTAATPPSSCSWLIRAPAERSSPAFVYRTWTWISTWRWCSAEAVGSERCPSAATPPSLAAGGARRGLQRPAPFQEPAYVGVPQAIVPRALPRSSPPPQPRTTSRSPCDWRCSAGSTRRLGPASGACFACMQAVRLTLPCQTILSPARSRCSCGERRPGRRAAGRPTRRRPVVHCRPSHPIPGRRRLLRRRRGAGGGHPRPLPPPARPAGGAHARAGRGCRRPGLAVAPSAAAHPGDHGRHHQPDHRQLDGRAGAVRPRRPRTRQRRLWPAAHRHGRRRRRWWPGRSPPQPTLRTRAAADRRHPPPPRWGACHRGCLQRLAGGRPAGPAGAGRPGLERGYRLAAPAAGPRPALRPRQQRLQAAGRGRRATGGAARRRPGSHPGPASPFLAGGAILLAMAVLSLPMVNTASIHTARQQAGIA